jgi:hypothetical protein
MKSNFIQLLKSQDISTLAAITFSLFTALFISLYLVINFSLFPPQIPLFYSLQWGESRLAAPTQLTIIPAVIVLVNLINLFISWHLHPSQIVFKRLLNITSFSVTFLLLITFIKIIGVFL